MTQSHALNRTSTKLEEATDIEGVNSSHTLNMETLNQSIGTLLRSYTRVINKQENRSDSLFRKQTKAPPFILEEFITVNHKDWNKMNYANYCFQYIHQNPVKAGLVEKLEDWIYSSARDYLSLRNGTLCDQKKTKELGMYY